MPATRQLFVLRHAKSSWEDTGLNDHDRPLAPRGRKAVKALAEHVRSADIEPVLVLCSSSRRTRETLEGVKPSGKWTIEPELYDAGPTTIVDRLRCVPEDTSSVMVIGHNPALQMLVLRLAGSGNGQAEGDLAEVQRKFPTGALATLEFDCHWDLLGPGCARLTAYVKPKQLTVG
ncbi:MAG TPA: histidine phosphatase family protein [Solirubrobacteraceae bacterium]|nr:histidine phosphatase family protein [Solirubrobacteraceae bacterium]